MHDLSSKFNTFYSTHVVLPQVTKSSLREKKTLNVNRLKAGLDEYNKENGTSYQVADVIEQGSVAMSTVTQNDSNNYDIDVAIIFDSDNIKDKGSIAIKNIVVAALRKKCVQMKKDPEPLTNCVRVEYADGYHVDFAIYRRTKQWDNSYIFEHAGSSWQKRDPKAINEWFKDELVKQGDELREIIRLSKMFCKSRDSWIMPGGLLQSVLCAEKLQFHDRLDETFYYTMIDIKNRLELYIETYNPTDMSKSLLLTSKDETKMINWKNRLESELNKMDTLFEEDCDQNKAMAAWHGFFNHEFWETSIEKRSFQETSCSHGLRSRGPTEMFIDEMFPINALYHLTIDCEVTANGFRPQSLLGMLRNKLWLKRNRKLRFFIKETNAPSSCDIYWKVRNVGTEAENRNCTRGEIRKTGSKEHRESTDFWGPHYVECYLIHNGICIAVGRIDVPIE